MKLSARNLCVHGSQRANNVTNRRDLSQELSKCFTSQAGINLQCWAEVKLRGRYFKSDFGINTSLSAHRTAQSWLVSWGAPEGQDQGQQLLFILHLQVQGLLTCSTLTSPHSPPPLYATSEGQTFFTASCLPLFSQGLPHHTPWSNTGAHNSTLSLAFTLLSAQATCCQPGSFSYQKHICQAAKALHK